MRAREPVLVRIYWLRAYTGCLAYSEHNRPERASCDGGTGELWRLQERTELMPQRSERDVRFCDLSERFTTIRLFPLLVWAIHRHGRPTAALIPHAQPAGKTRNL